MSVPFEVKYAKKCSNGHDLKKGDLVMFSPENSGSSISKDIICMQCDEFTMNVRHIQHKEPVTSKRFCGSCFLELPIAAVTECPNCDTKL